jgi:hypothetical protein
LRTPLLADSPGQTAAPRTPHSHPLTTNPLHHHPPGKKCDAGLFATEDLICVPDAPRVPAEATQAVGKAGGASAKSGGGGGANDDQERRKRDDAIGKKLGWMRSCAADADCPGSRACIGAVCIPCGSPGQACCSQGAPCRGFGGKVACEYDAQRGANMCGVRAPKQ